MDDCNSDSDSGEAGRYGSYSSSGCSAKILNASSYYCLDQSDYKVLLDSCRHHVKKSEE